MRTRVVLASVSFVLLARLGVACSHDVGPGDYCQDGWFADYDCPPGYGCNDSESWTCTKLQEPSYPGSYPSSAYTPAPPSTGPYKPKLREAGTEVADAGVDADASADEDGAAPLGGDGGLVE